MRRIIGEKQAFRCFSVPRDKAQDMLKQRQQTFKLELIRDLDLPEYSFYENGPFLDLCKGPHVDNTAQIPVVKLLKVSGAYWRGSEKNPMLQRIYGTAFGAQTELNAYLNRLEEAKKRDHRVLGKELDLFSIQDEVGAGFVLWHPKGARVRDLIETEWRRRHFASGYELLYTPHMGRSDLWETSGHLGFYQENMYPPMDIDDQAYFVKPMNCPFHIRIYKTKAWSYRQLPLRWAELGTVYRNERSGVLHGLLRVRGFTQDDAHIFCSPEQVNAEISRVLSFCLETLRMFGFDKFHVYLSTRPENKSVGEPEKWSFAEAALESAIRDAGLPFEVDAGGGAFYGPKIDIKIEDAIGRQWQCSTIQFDFNLPERFDLSYVGPDGQKHRPYMIHRALLGAIERFMGVLIEHYEGKFPLWLAPVQIKLLTISSDIGPFAQDVAAQLTAAGLRVELDDSAEKIGYKIRQATMEKVPYMAVIGRQEAAAGEVALRQRGTGDLGKLPIAQFITRLTDEAKL
jgi:threonyl-tRNA synthetase